MDSEVRDSDQNNVGVNELPGFSVSLGDTHYQPPFVA